MTTNITPTSTVMTFSKTSYLLNQTKTRPDNPHRIAHHLRSMTSGNSAWSGSALDDIAAAP